MANLSLFLYQLIPLFTSFLDPTELNPKSKPHSHVNVQEYKTLFVFGDSLFDPGNNQYLNETIPAPSDPTRWPYGESYFDHPTGRLSDGRTVPDFIAQFAKLPILEPYLQPASHRFSVGANFASAGAGVLADTHPGTIHLRKQLDYFKEVKKSLRNELGDEEAKNVLNRAVYLFSVGGNDYFDFSSTYPNSTETQQRQHVETVIGNLTSVLKEIYNLGGRKIAFQNAGPLGCPPIQREMNPILGEECDETPSALARLHNKYLAAVMKKLSSKLPGFKYSIFDYYNSLADRVTNPSKYGFKEARVACCGIGTHRGTGCGGGIDGTGAYELCSDPSEYVWFDAAHTTERTNHQLAELMWSGKPNVTGPYSFHQWKPLPVPRWDDPTVGPVAKRQGNCRSPWRV